MRARLFWNLGLTYLALILAVFLAINFYASRAVRQDYVRATFSQLASLSNVAQAKPPRFDDPEAVLEWTNWLATSGASVSVIDPARRKSRARCGFSRPSISNPRRFSRGGALGFAFGTGRFSTF